MIDGVKIYYPINDFEAWKRAVNIRFYTHVEVETGAIKERIRQRDDVYQSTITHKGQFETYFLTIKETHRRTINNETSISHLLFVEGSLYKNHFGGSNYLPFTWHHLQSEIEHMEEKLLLNSEMCKLENLEAGENVVVDFPVYEFLEQNLLSYKGKQFNRYKPDKNGVCLGFYCEQTQYSVKIYSKGKQHNLPYHLLRFELRYEKMQILNRLGIKYLSDLKNESKVVRLLSLLTDAWKNVLVYDSSINAKTLQLKPKETELLENGLKANFWAQLKQTTCRSTFNHYRNKFRELVATYGKNVHKTINDLIIDEWQNLFKNCTNLPRGKKEDLNKFTVKIKCKNVQKPFLPPYGEPVLLLQTKKYCLSCGRDITQQNNRSRFCSAKFVGEKEAHRCRNINSNSRNNFKRKIESINGKGVLFDVIPFFTSLNKK